MSKEGIVYSKPTVSINLPPKKGDIIDIRANRGDSGEGVIIFSDEENVEQFGNAAQSYIEADEEAEKRGVEMSLDHLINVGIQKGYRIERRETTFLLPEAWRSRKRGIFRNKKGSLAWQDGGRKVVLIIPRLSTINPVTGEGLIHVSQGWTTGTFQQPPVLEGDILTEQTNLQPTENLASHIPSGNTDQQDTGLAKNPYLKAPAQFKKAA